MRCATRGSCSAGRPIHSSTPSGPTMFSCTKSPMLLPVTRRTSSPPSQPYVSAWYPCVESGSNNGFVSARRDVTVSQSSASGSVIGPSTVYRPPRCDSNWATVMSCLP